MMVFFFSRHDERQAGVDDADVILVPFALGFPSPVAFHTLGQTAAGITKRYESSRRGRPRVETR